MQTLPPSLQQIALFLERLPGIGRKTANRLALYFLRLPQPDLHELADTIEHLKERTHMCTQCNNLTESDLCDICSDSRRDHSQITVVESVLDIVSFENGNIYQGRYFVLHGKIDPLNHIGPEDIFVDKFLTYVQKNGKKISEIVLATNPDMEGEATAMYMRNALREIQKQNKYAIKITRLGYGLPIGANLEYTDYMTLKKALENRNTY